jgi:phosphate starvation-inducible PhoH-like protein
MRGRTLENAFIILDEAQNATIDQLKMFLTRLGFISKMIVTGDISQVDLPNSKKSGLKVSANLLKGLDEVGLIIFDKNDVVRHPLVAKIIERFEKLEE